MDIKASCKEVSEELARELLIAISYSLPDQVLELNSVPENFNSVDNVVVSNNDGAEKYRLLCLCFSDLNISIKIHDQMYGQPQINQLGIELDPGVPSQGPSPSKEPAPLWAPSYEVFGDPVRFDATVLRTSGAGSNTASALSEVARLPADMAVWKQFTNQEVIDNLRRGLMMAIQGSLELEDRDEAELKREDAEESLRATLKANIQAEERIKALEAEVAERENATFAQGRVEAETIMANQLPGIYNEAFLVRWKALFAWSETEEIPLLPLRESLPYSDAPIGVLEEEVQEPLPQSPKEGDDAPPFD
uniref:Uncharacterized protein n=1 Tax=Fagus sylvatica TaxID=28930 RepID=A0A2N9FU19_FAGSY